MPVLKRALAGGLDGVEHVLPRLRLAHAEWEADPTCECAGSAGCWTRCSSCATASPRPRTRTRRTASPSSACRCGRTTSSATARTPSLLVHVAPAGAALDRPLADEDWAASPIDRAAELARASEVPLALVTNGDRWTLVWSRRGETTGTCAWRAEVWREEPITLQAFTTLLGARRFFALPVEQGLEALLRESADKQQEVTDRLGAQVRRAVELLIATLDREDRDRHGELLRELPDDEVYRGAVTVMMRLVFLFVAEERRLLPID